MMRVQKYLSQQKILSRREAEDYIRRGLIKLNGKIITEMGVLIDPEKDRIEVLENKEERELSKLTVVLYKPRGIVCSRNPAEGKTVFQAFPDFVNLNVVGRLDKDSEGLLLLSNDGVITAIVTGKDHLIEKEYQVTTREPISSGQLKKMEEGIIIDGKKTLPARAERLSPKSFTLILTEGRHHQIRRMADFLHLTIERLVRVRIGNITLAGLSSGKSRVLNEKEIKILKSYPQ